MLVRCRDTATRGVVVGTEMRGHAATTRRCQQEGQVDFTSTVDDRLRSFDHHFEFERACGQTRLAFKQIKKIGESCDLFGNRNLRQRDDEILRQFTARLFHQSRNKNVERPHTACAQFFGEGLDADADERRQRSVLHSLGYFNCGRGCVSVFFIVRSIAVAVFKVDAKIFHRLAAQFFADAVVDCMSEPGGFVFPPHLFAISLQPF